MRRETSLTGRSAVVVGRALEFGLVRMFESTAGATLPSTIRVFQTAGVRLARRTRTGKE